MTPEPTKRCPFCAEVILAAARKCKHCGEFLDKEQPAAPPPSPKPSPAPKPTTSLKPPPLPVPQPTTPLKPPPLPARKPVVDAGSSTATPAWVYLVFLVYGGLVGVVVFGPFVLAAIDGRVGNFLVAGVFSGLVVILGASLLVIPIGHHWNLPKTQRSIIFPLLGSATCAALLFAGFSLAANEFLKGNIPKDTHETVGYTLLGCIPIVWLLWLFVFAGIARSTDRMSLSGRMYKSLLAGSVLELLVAIPMHLVVRRRAECCAGQGTGMGIGVGLIVMLIAIGPAVFLLFYRRYKDVYARHAKDEW